MLNKFVIKDNITELYWRGKTILIDTEDLNKINHLTWNISGGRYAISRINNKNILLHRLILGLENASKDDCVDHINRNILDNRKSNLRICTNAENQQNSKIYKNNKTGVKGVHINRKCPNRPYVVNITINKTTHWLGQFATLEEAIVARAQAELQYFTPIKSIID